MSATRTELPRIENKTTTTKTAKPKATEAKAEGTPTKTAKAETIPAKTEASQAKSAETETSPGQRVSGPDTKAPRTSTRRKNAKDSVVPRTTPLPPSLGGPPISVASKPPLPAPAAAVPESPPPRSLEEQADIVRRVIYPSMMAAALGLDNLVGVAGYRLFLDELIRDAVNPGDLVEQMLLQQVAMLHFRAGQLQISASAAVSPEGIEVCTRGSVALTAEFRKSVLVLLEYRERACVLPTKRRNSSDAGGAGAAEPTSPP